MELEVLNLNISTNVALAYNGSGICARFNGANTMLCAVAYENLNTKNKKNKKTFLKHGQRNF